LVGILRVLPYQGCITDAEAGVIEEKLWNERTKNEISKCTE
jgi:hypothetical protein